MSDSSGLSSRQSDADEDVGESIFGLIERLYPICRSITGDGVRKTLDVLKERIPLDVFEVASGTRVFDWYVPKEWNVKNAHIHDSRGRKVVDFDQHNLHLVSYSVPIREKMCLSDLKPHLHSLKENPDWIPYRTSYYTESWGFCLADTVLQALEDDLYEVVIDSTLADGSLTYGECFVPGQCEDEVLIYTHTCHPSLANDNCSGMAVATALAEDLMRGEPRLSYRFVFGPGTIGSITWLSQNEDRLERIQHGLVLGLVGDSAGLRYKSSRYGDHVIDRAARHVLESHTNACLERFSPYGYDERQFCSPGINLPVGRLTRSPEGGYPEYHSSADNLTLVKPDALAGSFAVCKRILGIVEQNTRYLNLAPMGEPQLGRRGLYRAMGGEDIPDREYALLWILNQSDGRNSLMDISERSGLTFEVLAAAAGELTSAGLLRDIDSSAEVHGGRES